MTDEEFGECWLILETIGRPAAHKKGQWVRIIRPLDYDRVKRFLEKWAKSSLPSPEDVLNGIRSGKSETVRTTCNTCNGYGQVPVLAITAEGSRKELGCRCECPAGASVSALPTPAQVRPPGGQVILNPTLAQRRETGSVQSWLDFGKEAV